MADVAGVDIRSERSVVAVVDTDARRPEPVVVVVPTLVARSVDGHLVAGDDVAGAPPGSTGRWSPVFVERLGDPAPVILDGTPYGVEALVGAVLASLVARSGRGRAAAAEVVAICHPDDLDPYRAGLFVEAARTAGIDAASVLLVPRTRAIAALADLAVAPPTEQAGAVGAALEARRRWLADHALPPPLIGQASVAGSVVAGVAGGAVAGGLATGATDAAAATASGVVPMTMGTAGPAGVPLAAPTAYSGVPVAGTGTAAAGGTPMSAAGSGTAGTPMASGAGGNGYTGLSMHSSPTGGRVRRGIRLAGRSRPVPMPAVLAAVAVVTVAGGAVVLATRDDPPASAPTFTTVAVTTVPQVVRVTTSTSRSTTATSPPPTSTAPATTSTSSTSTTSTSTTTTVAATTTLSPALDPRGVWTATGVETSGAAQGTPTATFILTIDTFDPSAGSFSGTLGSSAGINGTISGQLVAGTVTMTWTDTTFGEVATFTGTMSADGASMPGQGVDHDGITATLQIVRTGPLGTAAPTTLGAPTTT